METVFMTLPIMTRRSSCQHKVRHAIFQAQKDESPQVTTANPTWGSEEADIQRMEKDTRMTQKIHKDAWSLEREHLAVLAAIASAKETSMSAIAAAGIEVSETILDRLVSLDLVKRKGAGPVAHTPHRITTQGRSLLWHQKWRYTGYPMFAHGHVVYWALYLSEVFGDIQTFRLEMDLGMSKEELEPYLAKMAEHSMVVRDGNTAILLDRSRWKMDH